MLHCSSQQNYVFSVFTLEQDSFVLYQGWQLPELSTLFVVINIKSNRSLHKLKNKLRKENIYTLLIKLH